MTKQQAERYRHFLNALESHGVTTHEADTLLRAERTLHTWAEHECNGAIQRDEATGKPSWHNTNSGKRLCATSDREAGALKRAQAIAEVHGLTLYHQGDPRGCALYLLRPGDVPKGQDPGAYYSNGIACCL